MNVPQRPLSGKKLHLVQTPLPDTGRSTLGWLHVIHLLLLSSLLLAQLALRRRHPQGSFSKNFFQWRTLLL